jgi:hypothetical protein
MTSFRQHLLEGQVIPAHPLALDEHRRLDERHQRALTRYYVDAGAGGVAVGVHTTQFAIRTHGLYRAVLALAAETAAASLARAPRPFVLVAGIVGDTPQAIGEAETAVTLGYDAGLLSLGAWAGASDAAILEHCARVAEVIPVFGFYLQPAVGGRVLDYAFWRELAEIPNVVAIKIAPFNRYQTIDVVRAVAESGRANDIAIYTGNDDNIVNDLTTEWVFGGIKIRFAGGLLGHWAVWTKKAVEIAIRATGPTSPGLSSLNVQVTDSNAALFDVANNFHGCIAGIHEVLRRQGLLEGIWCLDPNEGLSPGQADEIDRVYREYPHLNDDAFVRENLDNWLR